MKEKVYLITGATDGIGRIAALDLARENPEATLLIHGRNKEKLNRSVDEIRKAAGHEKTEPFSADFSSMDEVRGMAKEILSRYDSLSLLINNAGAGFAAPRHGKDGTEMRLAVNYLAPFLLTTLLLPALKKGAPSRVVNVASAGQSPIQFDDIMLEKNFDPVKAYAQSKLALIMFTLDLAETLRPEHITVNCLHPGTYLDTGMVREAGIQPLGTAQSGADALVYLATSPGLADTTGKYFNVQKETQAHVQAYDAAARSRLGKIGRTLTGLNA